MTLGALFSLPEKSLMMQELKLPKSSALSRVHNAWKWAKMVRA